MTDKTTAPGTSNGGQPDGTTGAPDNIVTNPTAPGTGKPPAGTAPADGIYQDGSKDDLTDEEKKGGEYVPRSRLNEVTDQVKTLQLELQKFKLVEKERLEREAAEKKARLENEQDWKSLYELEKQNRLMAEQENEQAKIATLRLKVGQKLKLKPELAERLRGNTEAEMELDGLQLLELMPKASSAADGDSSLSRRPVSVNPGKMSDEDAIIAKKRESLMYRDAI